MTNKLYKVIWEIHVHADSPWDAAREARDCMPTNGDSLATNFTVIDENTGTSSQIDIADDDPQIPDILPVLGTIPSPDPIVKMHSEDEDNRFTASVYREIDNKEDHHPNGGLAHDTEEQARKYARKFPGLWVYIVESRGKYYVDESGFLRSWEVLIHEGYGKYA